MLRRIAISSRAPAGGSTGCPRLVVARRTGALAAAVFVPGRTVGEGGAGQVRLVRLLPRPPRAVGLGYVVDRIVQPSVPFGRDARRLDLTVVDDPAPPPPRAVLLAPLLVIAVAELVRADRLTLPPGEQPDAERCHRSYALHALRKARPFAKRAGLCQTAPATSSPPATLMHGGAPWTKGRNSDILRCRSCGPLLDPVNDRFPRSEEHTSELQSLMRISYAVFCLKKKNHNH